MGSEGARSPLRVVFVCTGNSCRSQMAEGWARALWPKEIEVFSAGTRPQKVNPLAVRAMREVGVDISGHRSKVFEALGGEFDVVVTVCDSAREACPVMPGVDGARVVHAGFEDPPRLAEGARTEEEALGHYRRVRDEIRAFVEGLPGALRAHGHDAHRHTSMKGMSMSDTNAKSCCAPGCCDTSAETRVDAQAADAVREQVRAGYTKIAESGSWSAAQAGVKDMAAATGCCGGGTAKAAESAKAGGGCCGPATFSPEQLARAIGYTSGELAATPEGANMGLSCGNPTAIAALRPGEVVLDLGSGGGFDCFVAGPKVGATGRVIGVDMTPDMVSKARRNVAMYRERTGLDNVEFRLGEIENLPVADASVDVVISNCVLNLSPDKARVWREMARVLKPGGRVAVSDLALLRALPEAIVRDLEALVGCIAGAVLIEETRAQMRAAGFTEIVLTPKPEYIEAMTNWEDPLYRKIVESLPRGTRVGDYVTSLDIAARR